MEELLVHVLASALALVLEALVVRAIRMVAARS
jgi:hypothetical protein